jgi:hypothetical protein
MKICTSSTSSHTKLHIVLFHGCCILVKVETVIQKVDARCKLPRNGLTNICVQRKAHLKRNNSHQRITTSVISYCNLLVIVTKIA